MSEKALPGGVTSGDFSRSDRPGAPVAVRPLDRGRERDAADVLARAFRDGPISRAVVGDSEHRRMRANRHGMRISLRGCRSHGLTLVADPPGTESRDDRIPHGVLAAIGPGGFPLEPPSLLAQLHSALIQGLGVSTRWGDVYRALADVHPLEPHWYLSLLGVEPELQQHGIGWALLVEWLEQVDRENAPSYLETDLESNVAFYARAGFEIQHEMHVLGTRVWCLWRRPRGSRESLGPDDTPSAGANRA